MKNLAGSTPQVADRECTIELNIAKILILADWPECLRSEGEVPSNIIGALGGWRFRRAWYYWVAEWKPPYPVSLSMEQASVLQITHGDCIRADGDGACRGPKHWWPENGTPNLYHIDTQEGLNIFSKVISNL